ncbi:hypothetical protein ACQJBY_067170 [Aegilops geniculata]
MSIQGLLLEVRVTGCRKLRDTEFFSRQDPYVIVEYANTKLRTRTCTDGGRNPSFDEKFHIPLIEGLRELSINVWNSNTINTDDFIGSCRVPLNKVLTSGYDDASWPLQTRHMKFPDTEVNLCRSAGEVKLIMHFDVSAMKNKMAGKTSGQYAPSPYGASSASYPAPSAYAAAPPPHQAYGAPSHAPYPAPSAYSTPPPQQPYPTPPPQQPYPQQGGPPTSHPPQPYGQPYPPQPYGQPYPPQPYGQQPYPPQPYGQPYPPPSAAQSPYPPAPYPGAYPPRPY